MTRAFAILLLTVVARIGYSQSSTEFSNPILSGFYPDPSICRVGSDYYLVNSSFSYYPGIPIFHSTDLVSWEQIGYVMNDPSKLELTKGVSRGIFAPAIRFNNGIFYVTCTLVDGKGNFVVTSKNPSGPWSDPVWISQVNGIDPSMFFDEDGKAYIIYNSVAPDNKPLYEGHRTIRMYEFDLKQMKVVGDEILMINGGTNINKKPIWIEGPHIYRKDGYYYLMAAEGGTAYNHSEVVFRSMDLRGPYVPYENNPILTQRDLNPARKNPITSTGHADLVETQNGDWWAVFLGCRPYEGDYYNLGRETFLAPVSWNNGWPIINPGFDEVQNYYPLPKLPSPRIAPAVRYSGNFTYIDEFDNEKLGYDWMFLRTPHEDWYSLSAKRGELSLQVRPERCTENVNPSFIGHRQQHRAFEASTALNFNPPVENEKAGLLIFQNESHFYFLTKSIDDGQIVIQLYKSSRRKDVEGQMELMASQRLTEAKTATIQLKVEAGGSAYSFSYAEKQDQWILLKGDVDAKFLSTKEAGGFVGCFIALYATSLGKPSSNHANFGWFKYVGMDEVYMRSLK